MPKLLGATQKRPIWHTKRPCTFHQKELCERQKYVLIVSPATTRYYAKEVCMSYQTALYIPGKRTMLVTRIALIYVPSKKGLLDLQRSSMKCTKEPYAFHKRDLCQWHGYLSILSPATTRYKANRDLYDLQRNPMKITHELCVDIRHTSLINSPNVTAQEANITYDRGLYDLQKSPKESTTETCVDKKNNSGLLVPPLPQKRSI